LGKLKPCLQAELGHTLAYLYDRRQKSFITLARGSGILRLRNDALNARDRTAAVFFLPKNLFKNVKVHLHVLHVNVDGLQGKEMEKNALKQWKQNVSSIIIYHTGHL